MAMDHNRPKVAGMVQDVALVTRKPWYGDPYHVWEFTLVAKPEASGSAAGDRSGERAGPTVHVGEWFPAAIHETALITVDGGDGHAHGGNYFQADTITYDDPGARFSKRGEKLSGDIVDLRGTVSAIKQLTTGSTTVGYAFLLLDENNKAQYVLLRGRRCSADIFPGQAKIRVRGRRDTGGVIHTRKVEGITFTGNVVVQRGSGRGKGRKLATAIIALVFAVIPWVVAVRLELGDDNAFVILVIVWTVLTVTGAATALWAFLRTGHRT